MQTSNCARCEVSQAKWPLEGTYQAHFTAGALWTAFDLAYPRTPRSTDLEHQVGAAVRHIGRDLGARCRAHCGIAVGSRPGYPQFKPFRQIAADHISAACSLSESSHRMALWVVMPLNGGLKRLSQLRCARCRIENHELRRRSTPPRAGSEQHRPNRWPRRAGEHPTGTDRLAQRPVLGVVSPTAPMVLPPFENLAGRTFLEALISSYASRSVRGFVGVNGKLPLPSEPEAP